MLTLTERQTLLRIARHSIACRLRSERFSAPDCLTDALRSPAGSFVTLRKGNDLRGCIGSVIAVAPLHRSVADSAVNAAFRDPRFAPLRNEEFSFVSIEISVLGPIERVTDVSSIVVGRDGLIVRHGESAGLLLPQVATEQRWDRDTFLSHTCLKAGLEPDQWRRERCVIERFDAEVFGEEQLHQ
ncbi:MAG TPA: AmmeMemoRadiSam system protein A [Thermoanaerobaculia bacterium]|nr:AmmeMemoRadiSam system protein A [Rhodothermia bacterium]